MSIFCCTKKKQSVWILIVVFIVLIGITAFTNNVLAVGQGGIGGRPAYPRDDNPRTESIFVHTLKPNAIQEEGILLVNNSAEQKTLLVYSVDSVVSSDGAFACRQLSEPKKSVGSWIELAKFEVTLDSGTNEMVPFTINVPQTASVGEHNGCIVIQEKKEKEEGQTGMVLSFRTGLRVAITIPGNITRKLEIIDLTVELQKDGDYLLQPSVKNFGNVSIDASVQVVTRCLFGLTHIQHGGQFPILRGEVSDWNFELKKPFWGGWYQSSLTIEYEEGSETELGKETGEQKIQLTESSVWFFSTPQPIALAIEIIILLLIGFSGFLFWLSRRRKKWIKENWMEYDVTLNDDINSLAKHFDVSWKLLAKVNKLQPPYGLKAGEKIKVPPTK